MTATSPEQVIQQFSLYVSNGNFEGALALYEPDATFAFQPGEVVYGLDAIRSALAGFVALKPKLTGEIQKVLEAGETALVINKWKLEGTQPDGTPISMSGQSADVLRRLTDGAWRLLIDDPWGPLRHLRNDFRKQTYEENSTREENSREHSWKGRN